MVTGSQRTLTRADWRRQLEAWQGAGYYLEQSEWHHTRFEAQTTAKPARSTFSVVLHVRRGVPRERLIVRAQMEIQWRKPADAAAPPRAGSIRIPQIEVLRRSGPPPFVPEIVAKGPAPAVPLLVYDMDSNGFPDIVLPLHDLWYRNVRGRLTGERLFRHRPRHVTSAVLGDFNGDRRVDLIVGALDEPAQLYVANGEGRFAAKPESLPTGP